MPRKSSTFFPLRKHVVDTLLASTLQASGVSSLLTLNSVELHVSEMKGNFDVLDGCEVGVAGTTSEQLPTPQS